MQTTTAAKLGEVDMLAQYAKFDPLHALDGLFVPRVKEGAMLDVSATVAGAAVSFTGPQLGADHQSVLLALVARAGNQKPTQDPAALQPVGVVKDEKVMCVTVTKYQLLLDAGMSANGGKDYRRLLSILDDMSVVTMHREATLGPTSTRLIAYHQDDSGLHVLLNWRLSWSIAEDQFCYVDLEERRALKCPVARIMHTWLSVYVRQGSKLARNGAKIETLMRHVYSYDLMSGSAQRERKRRFLASLAAIVALESWSISVGRIIEITRS